ncbi:hypothetical protein [Piscirickettsia litoralis]|uniref:Uncharacterized protein n=1 Tax=Piscirickettsia litoralis TaxID=1891921 RepID=A0ABX3A2N3_9GAMM|nr:hypothetical protein [Piscirickettsia litoralis]ODN41710.1 hypothetical protein BGC07_00315 [Piscirickettsia litoralis]
MRFTHSSSAEEFDESQVQIYAISQETQAGGHEYSFAFIKNEEYRQLDRCPVTQSRLHFRLTFGQYLAATGRDLDADFSPDAIAAEQFEAMFQGENPTYFPAVLAEHPEYEQALNDGMEALVDAELYTPEREEWLINHPQDAGAFAQWQHELDGSPLRPEDNWQLFVDNRQRLSQLMACLQTFKRLPHPLLNQGNFERLVASVGDDGRPLFIGLEILEHERDLATQRNFELLLEQAADADKLAVCMRDLRESEPLLTQENFELLARRIAGDVDGYFHACIEGLIKGGQDSQENFTLLLDHIEVSKAIANTLYDLIEPGLLELLDQDGFVFLLQNPQYSSQFEERPELVGAVRALRQADASIVPYWHELQRNFPFRVTLARADDQLSCADCTAYDRAQTIRFIHNLMVLEDKSEAEIQAEIQRWVAALAAGGEAERPPRPFYDDMARRAEEEQQEANVVPAYD